ncbi:neuropeptides capa receptor-like [Cloeon dipterum]|uniref:neuropeptides capa receptor-like n=1 Tax=Cloeon dipterum TaxID=197152 RepID=UPI00321FD0D1
MNQSGTSFGHKDSGVSIYDGIECSQEFIDSNLDIYWEDILFSTIYIALLITGVTSNFLVCVVILKKPEMQTFTNKLVFNLAVTDILLLSTSQTIVAFSVERYLAICHPLSSYTRSASSRPLRIIAAIWLTAFVMALPFGYGSDTETLQSQMINDLDEVCDINFEVCGIFHVLGYDYKKNKPNIIYIFLTFDSSNTFWNISMTLIFLSSTLNACLYNLMSSKFRKAFK